MSTTTAIPLGRPAASLTPEARHEALKELVNKIAWALGSTYRCPYTNRKTPTRLLAITLAASVLDRQGFPEHLETAK